jgi:adenine-specific DNA-methyltransferase
VVDATEDARSLGLDSLHVLGWAFEANVGEIKANIESEGDIGVELVMIRPDALADGVKVTEPAGLFSPLALPEIDIVDREDDVVVSLKGVGLFNRKTKKTDYHKADSGYIAAWYLDEDYDGDCFVDCQMFFDFKKAPNLTPAVGSPVDPEEFELTFTSEPFELGQYRRVAVKVVDVYGNESTVVRNL